MHRGVLDRGSTEARMSSLLFITFIADVKDFLKKRQNGGARLGKRRIYTLAYVDDLAMAETKKEMKKMLKSLERYLEEKELTLNADKSKMFFVRKRELSKKGTGNGRTAR